MSNTCSDGDDANISDNDTLDEKDHHPLSTTHNGNLLDHAEEEKEEQEGEDVAMISHGPKDAAGSHGRSLDDFLEDAYQQHSFFPSSSSVTSSFHSSSQSSGCQLFPRWKYWMIMVRVSFCQCVKSYGEILVEKKKKAVIYCIILSFSNTAPTLQCWHSCRSGLATAVTPRRFSAFPILYRTTLLSAICSWDRAIGGEECSQPRSLPACWSEDW